MGGHAGVGRERVKPRDRSPRMQIQNRGVIFCEILNHVSYLNIQHPHKNWPKKIDGSEHKEGPHCSLCTLKVFAMLVDLKLSVFGLPECYHKTPYFLVVLALWHMESQLILLGS